MCVDVCVNVCIWREVHGWVWEGRKWEVCVRGICEQWRVELRMVRV